MKNTDALGRWGLAIILLHAIVTVVHAVAHSNLQIVMLPWQNFYIFTVIVALPIVAGILLARRSGSGFLMLFLSMLGSLIFGGYYHFILPGPDNVASLAPHSWTVPFQLTAAMLGLTELVGTVVGLLGLSRRVSPT